MASWRKPAVIAVGIVAAWLLRRVAIYVAGILAGGVVIAVLICPLQKRLEAHMRRAFSIFAAWLLVIGAVLLAVALLIPAVVAQAKTLCAAWPQFCELIARYISASGPVRWSASEAAGMVEKLVGVFAQLGDGVSSAFGAASRLGMMWITSIFLLMDRERYLLMAELLIPFRYRRRALRMGRRIRRELKLFVGGQAMVGLCVGALAAVGLLLVGVDGAVLLGLITGLFNMIPYFGPVLAAVPVILLAWMDGWVRAALAGAVLIAVQQIDSMFLSPKIMSGATGLSPLVVLVSLAAGGYALGVPGMLLAIPAAIVLRIVFHEAVQNSGIYPEAR